MAKLMENKRQKTFTPKRTAPLPSIVFVFTLLLIPTLFEADASMVFRIPCVDNLKFENNSKERTMRVFGIDEPETYKRKNVGYGLSLNIDKFPRWIFHLDTCICFQIVILAR